MLAPGSSCQGWQQTLPQGSLRKAASLLETLFAGVLYMKGLLFLRNKKTPGRVVYLVREVLFCVAQGCRFGVELLSSGRTEALEAVIQKQLEQEICLSAA